LYDRRGKATADLVTLYDENPDAADRINLRHPSDHTKYRCVERNDLTAIEPMLVPVLTQGKLVYQLPDLDTIRTVRQSDVDRLDPGVRRIMYPHIYHVSLSQKLWDLKQKLILETVENH
jgi:nicotinate phosphoribosyltransferase